MTVAPRTFDITNFGAVGNGVNNDWAAIQDAMLSAAKVNGCVYIPAGRYICPNFLTLPYSNAKITIRGDGGNVSILVGTGGSGIFSFIFEQENGGQPFGLTLLDVGLHTRGQGSTALVISYGNPSVTSDHCRPSTYLRGVDIVSDWRGNWANGIRIEAAWNVTMTDVYISGNSAGGVWNNLSGNGIEYQRMCVNAHHSNVRCNFWANGFYYNAGAGGNTEGLFFTNCSMVAVKQGVWVIGNANCAVPRVSTLTWVGGMIECRVSGVVSGGSAAFHLQNVWTALITGCQMLTDALPTTHTTYGIFIDNCHGVVVTCSDINAWHHGIFTVGVCKGINSNGNTYTNCHTQNQFNAGTSQSRSYGHTVVNDAPRDVDGAGVNKLGFVP